MKYIDQLEMGHVGIIVDDADASAKMYEKIFGIKDFKVYDFAPLKVYVYGEEAQLKMRIALGTLAGGVKLELIQVISGDCPQKEYIDRAGPGMHHINFYTDHYDDIREQLVAEEIPIIFEAEVEDERGYRRTVYFEDKKMGVIEFSELPHKR